MRLYEVGGSGINHGMAEPAVHEHLAVGLAIAYVAQEYRLVVLLAPGLGVVDKQEVAHLLQLQDGAVGHIHAQRAALHHHRHVGYMGDFALEQYPPQTVRKVAGYLLGIEIIHLLRCHLLMAQLY